jgi:hypothetical protein
MPVILSHLDAKTYVPHALHASDRNWIETNCYVDLWIELLASLDMTPEAMLGFTVTQDFEGDQFTFFKPSTDSLQSLYGVTTSELAMFDTCERHFVTQVARGRFVLVEVDGYFLPDTRGVTYHSGHSKTTICINAIDPEARRLSYFHNAGYADLSGDDYDGIVNAGGKTHDGLQTLLPYTEFVKVPAKRKQLNVKAVIGLLASEMSRRPKANPLREFKLVFPMHVEDLLQRPDAYFHTYAFNTLRQCGANFELLASHLNWLAEKARIDLTAPALSAQVVSEGMKALQFKLARALARRRPAGLSDFLEPLADHYDQLMSALDRKIAPHSIAA